MLIWMPPCRDAPVCNCAYNRVSFHPFHFQNRHTARELHSLPAFRRNFPRRNPLLSTSPDLRWKSARPILPSTKPNSDPGPIGGWGWAANWARLHASFEGWFAVLQLPALKLDPEPDRLRAVAACATTKTGKAGFIAAHHIPQTLPLPKVETRDFLVAGVKGTLN